MNSTFRDLNTNEVIELNNLIEIWSSSSDTRLKGASPKKIGGSLRPYVNVQHNSRTGLSLPKGNWSVQWQADIKSVGMPTFILQTQNKIVIQAEDGWILFNNEGKVIQLGPRLGGDIVLDPNLGVFYIADINSFVSTINLADGSLFSLVGASFGTKFERTLLARKENSMLIHSFAMPEPPFIGPPDFTILELQDLGNPIEIDDFSFVTSAEDRASIISNTIPLLVALDGDYTVAVVPNHIYRLDKSLKVVADLMAEFTPLAFSLDEAGRIYLLAQSKGKNVLWVVTPQGERILSVELQNTLLNPLYPPVINYDHQILILDSNEIQAFDIPSGLVWQWKSASDIAGVIAMADGGYLVATGSQVFVLSHEGEPTKLITVPSETLITPPVLTSEGKILVASAEHLFCLESH